MALKPSELDVQLDTVAERIRRARATLVNCKANIGTAQADLASIPTAYSELITTINDLAAANPNNTYYQGLKARKDALATEFNALNTTATSMVNDLANDDPSA